MTVIMSNLRAGEKVDLVVRRHWIAFVLLGVYGGAGVAFSVSIFFILGVGSGVLLIMTLFWMFYLLFMYVTWLNYELDIFIFTNNRVVCIEQKSFLNRAVGETTLDKVQEVGIETKGLFANIFDFGTLSIMTAGSTESFDMSFCPKPMIHSRYINNLVDRYRDSLYGGGKTTKDDKRKKLQTVGKMQTKEKVKTIINGDETDLDF
ncbi:PH domain-containing protein [Candidatus Gracilibacteria bacterium]|nr:PH domain-containing protein [Candidatus Gracilibacteria bacterium]